MTGTPSRPGPFGPVTSGWLTLSRLRDRAHAGRVGMLEVLRIMMDTLSETLDRLAVAGFVDDLVAVDGELRSVLTHRRVRPEDLRVVEMIRFEGMSDPDDEAIVFALATPDGTPLGTYTVAYGPDTDSTNADVMAHLSRVASP